jgi:hypothetical protein
LTIANDARLDQLAAIRIALVEYDGVRVHRCGDGETSTATQPDGNYTLQVFVVTNFLNVGERSGRSIPLKDIDGRTPPRGGIKMFPIWTDIDRCYANEAIA